MSTNDPQTQAAISFAVFLTNLSFINDVHIVGNLTTRQMTIIIEVTEDSYEDYSSEVSGFDAANRTLARFLYACHLLSLKADFILQIFGGKIPDIYVFTDDWRVHADTTNLNLEGLKTYDRRTCTFE